MRFSRVVCLTCILIGSCFGAEVNLSLMIPFTVGHISGHAFQDATRRNLIDVAKSQTILRYYISSRTSSIAYLRIRTSFRSDSTSRASSVVLRFLKSSRRRIPDARVPIRPMNTGISPVSADELRCEFQFFRDNGRLDLLDCVSPSFALPAFSPIPSLLRRLTP